MKKLIIKLFLWAIVRPHYNAIVKRGYINESTLFRDFYNKMKEELIEVDESFNLDWARYETTDLIFVCFNFLLHFNEDKKNIPDIFIYNLKTQKERAKNKTK